jgi:hypothetical protein
MSKVVPKEVREYWKSKLARKVFKKKTRLGNYAPLPNTKRR